MNLSTIVTSVLAFVALIVYALAIPVIDRRAHEQNVVDAIHYGLMLSAGASLVATLIMLDGL